MVSTIFSYIYERGILMKELVIGSEKNLNGNKYLILCHFMI